MHPIIYPDRTEGGADKVRNYILKTCQEHKVAGRALVFAFIISDLDDPQISKILRDDDYVNALHKISGHYMTIFFLNDSYVDRRISKAKLSNQMRIELGVQKVNAPPIVSPKFLAKNLINRENLPSPSILFFQVIDNNMSDYSIAQLRQDEVEKGFIEMKIIIKKAVGSLSEVEDAYKHNSEEIFNLLKAEIESSESWKLLKRRYKQLISIKDFVLFWR